MSRSIIACAIASLCLMTPAARAVATVYTTIGAFNTAVPVSTLQNFDAGVNSVAPFTVGAITVSDPSPGDNVQLAGALFASGKSVQLVTNTGTPPTIQFAFASPITAFGVDIFDLGTVGATNLTFVLSNGDVGAFATAFSTGSAGQLLFRGVTSTTPFNSITLTNTASGDFIEYDNVRYAANVVPLPAAAWFGFALIGGIGAKRVSAGRARKNEIA